MTELNKILLTPKLKRRSIFGDEDAISLDDSKIYSPGYRTCLETEIDLWTQQIISIREECKMLKNAFKSESKITVSESSFSKEELDFFDHSFYYEYFNIVESICNKIQCAREIQKQNEFNKSVRLNAMKRMEKQIKNRLWGNEH